MRTTTEPSNATAAVDEDGLSGHTHLFHTLNSIRNWSEPIMRLLLAAGGQDRRASRRGKGYEWETALFGSGPRWQHRGKDGLWDF